MNRCAPTKHALLINHSGASPSLAPTLLCLLHEILVSGEPYKPGSAVPASCASCSHPPRLRSVSSVSGELRRPLTVRVGVIQLFAQSRLSPILERVLHFRVLQARAAKPPAARRRRPSWTPTPSTGLEASASRCPCERVFRAIFEKEIKLFNPPAVPPEPLPLRTDGCVGTKYALVSARASTSQ